jgi:hypothetical protein
MKATINYKEKIIIAEKNPNFYLKLSKKSLSSIQNYHLIWIENIQDLMFAIKQYAPVLIIINDNLSMINIEEIDEYLSLLRKKAPIIYLYDDFSIEKNRISSSVNYLKKDIKIDILVTHIKKYLSL